MAFVAVSAGIGAAGLLYSVGKGIAQDKQASDIEKANKRPTYQIPQEFYQNLNIADQLSHVGIPQQQYNNAVNSINQSQASGIAALNRSANPGAGLSSIVGQTNQANANLNAQDADARLNGLREAMQYRGQLAQQKLAAQQYNQFDKYTEDYNKAASLQTAANGNFQNAFNSASTAAGALATNYSDNHNNVVPASNGWAANTQGALNGAPQLNAVGSMTNYHAPNIPTTLPGTNMAQPNTYLNLPQYNPLTLQIPQYNNQYFPNANQ